MPRALRTVVLLGASLALAVTGASPAAAAPAARDLDVAFVLDTTGSMAQEIREAKERIQQLALALQATRPGARVRFGTVAYRDRQDEYLTRVSPLSADVQQSFDFLAALRAEGGGDAPEDVLAALGVALGELDWNLDEAADRQVVLIGDAPPHLDYPDGPRPEDIVSEAQRRRIVINSIGCRSLSADGIAFFRDTAYATEGSYQHIARVEPETAAASAGAPAPGLAAAVLSALGPGGAGEAPREPVGARLAETTAGGGRDLRVEHVPAAGKRSCGLLLRVPSGWQLSGDPHVTRGPDGLRVQLALVPGQGEQLRYELGECVPLASPIHLAFEEER